ncbi:flagellin [Lysinibacillus mangiferihumi]|uniref:Flagellin n=1 Tax=Lysinibacillus mangiferihumi TaxID=1130819 RepID=A0A4U2XZP1_9BACI|nr:flagellin [Lysinibacillus mangiferihumi]TKI53499.1 flagellin [Lysinibacillus mangiferihumi]
MRIQHNISALNAHRNLGANNTQASKNLEKLSSGYKINRAGDDAAGLAISEKMRGQIRGLDMATKNSQDSISLIQTAEGALNETHSILQRMRELSVQSANDTNVNTDREALQQEIEQLTKEIDRIANTTEFNTQKLLDGGFNGTFQIGANEGQTMEMGINRMDASALGLSATSTVQADVAAAGGGALKEGSYKVSGGSVFDANSNKVGKVSGQKIHINGNTTESYEFTAAKTSVANGSVITVKKDGAATLKTDLAGGAKELAAGSYEIVGSKIYKDKTEVGSVDGAGNASIAVGDKTLTFTATDLGLSGTLSGGTGANDISKFNVNGVEVSTREQAAGTITTIDTAIKSVSEQRSKLGAVQNRLEHTINNLGAASENLTAAESRIRDTDMAKEMMEFTKNNILMQAAQSMLAQANQQPQGVLQLLG